MKFANGLACYLDLDAAGKRHGILELQHSDSTNYFSVIPVPIAVIVGGKGPTIVLTAGNHGNEYEGQVILRRLFAETEPSQINGRIILLPALNYPAVLANSRISPLDNGNLNRSFPGRTDAGPTSSIAHFVTERLVPLADVMIDFHSGGGSADFIASTFYCTHPNADMSRRCLELAETFAAPYIYAIRGSDSPTGMDSHAQDAGVPFLSTELSGGAGVDMKATEIGYCGLRRVLAKYGILPWSEKKPPAPSRLLDGIDGATTVMAPVTGIFEPFVALGGEVKAGQPAGRVWAMEEIDRPPIILNFRGSGIVSVKRTTAQVVRGSYVYVVTPEATRDMVLSIRD